MNVKFSLEYRDYHITIDDDGEKIDVIVNFTEHQNKRSKERKIPKKNILDSLGQKGSSAILYLKNKEKAVVRDYKRNISYAVEVYCDNDIVTNIITSFNKPSMKAFKGEKVIIIKDENEQNKYLN